MKYLDNSTYLELKNELKDIAFNAISEHLIEESIQSHERSMLIFDPDMFENCLNKEEVEFAYNQFIRLCNEFDKLNTHCSITDVIFCTSKIEKIYTKLIHDITQETLNFINQKAEERIKTLNN